MEQLGNGNNGDLDNGGQNQATGWEIMEQESPKEPAPTPEPVIAPREPAPTPEPVVAPREPAPTPEPVVAS